ncbi:MAG: hypothetical protein IJV61_05790 [Paludibacteraceae bacterium]|nr:hypothetical protein [Paludibacteraceae bacterium]
MKRYHLILPFIIFAMMSTQAQTFQSQQILQTGVQYKGTVYEPFDDTPPSEQYSEGISSSPNRAPGKGGGIRKGFDTGAEYGRDDQYPVGEPWVLAIFALAFAGVVALRKRKNTTL